MDDYEVGAWPMDTIQGPHAATLDAIILQGSAFAVYLYIEATTPSTFSTDLQMCQEMMQILQVRVIRYTCRGLQLNLFSVCRMLLNQSSLICA